MSISLNQMKKLRCRFLDRKTGQPVSAVVVHLSLPIDDEAKRSLPISTLRTDATGYVSFDLQPITELGLDMVPAIHVSVPQVGLKNYDVLGQLNGPAKGDEALSYFPTRSDRAGHVHRPICMEFPIHVDRPSSAQESSEILCRVANLASVQRPDLCDYELSPYSFVTPVNINTGGECCESLAPSTLPVQEHLFYRVVVAGDQVR